MQPDITTTTVAEPTYHTGMFLQSFNHQRRRNVPMSRVNVEDSAIFQVKHLAFALGKDPRFILGCLVTMWHETQAIGLSESKLVHIARYFDMHKHEEIDNWLECMIDYGFLSVVDEREELYKIVGNDKHIERLNNLKSLAKRGGLAKASSVRQKRTPEKDSSVLLAQYNTVQYNTVHNKNKNTHTFDFESVYQKFPRKLGKQRGEKLFNQQIKTQKDFENLSRAVENYSRQMIELNQPKQFIKQFDTFMGCWRDWCDEEQKIGADKKAIVTLEELEAGLEAENRAKIAQMGISEALIEEYEGT
jgi:hypothetical protein